MTAAEAMMLVLLAVILWLAWRWPTANSPDDANGYYASIETPWGVVLLRRARIVVTWTGESCQLTLKADYLTGPDAAVEWHMHSYDIYTKPWMRIHWPGMGITAWQAELLTAFTPETNHETGRSRINSFEHRIVVPELWTPPDVVIEPGAEETISPADAANLFPDFLLIPSAEV